MEVVGGLDADAGAHLVLPLPRQHLRGRERVCVKERGGEMEGERGRKGERERERQRARERERERARKRERARESERERCREGEMEGESKGEREGEQWDRNPPNSLRPGPQPWPRRWTQFGPGRPRSGSCRRSDALARCFSLSVVSHFPLSHSVRLCLCLPLSLSLSRSRSLARSLSLTIYLSLSHTHSFCHTHTPRR